MTQEHSHTLGLGDVSEFSHLNLRMSSQTNGPYQTSEHTLEKGDDIGMNRKYLVVCAGTPTQRAQPISSKYAAL